MNLISLICLLSHFLINARLLQDIFILDVDVRIRPTYRIIHLRRHEFRNESALPGLFITGVLL